MKNISLLGCLSAFYLLILGVTVLCFSLIGFKLDGILMFEFVASLTGALGCAVIWYKQQKRAKYRYSA